LIFNTQDSLNFLKSITDKFPINLPVFFSGLATFSITPDLVPFDKWEDALHDFDWINIGTRKSHYPADTLALVKWAEPLRKWSEHHKLNNHERISGEELYKLAYKIAKKEKA
jgi:hypothetical protein